MLPERLSSDLCSLRPGVDRAAVTVEMVIGADGAVGETRFSRSLIRSERRLTYPEVDALLAGGGARRRRRSRTTSAAPRAVAAALRERRMERGALEAESAEPVVTLRRRPGGRDPPRGPDAGPLAGGGVHDRRQRGRRALPDRARGRRRSSATTRSRPRAASSCSTPSSRSSACPRRRCRAASSGPRSAAAPPRRPRGQVARYVARRRHRRAGALAAGAAVAAPGLLLAGRARPLAASRARPTCTSPRRSGATPTCWCTAACSTRSASASPAPGPSELDEAADHSSATEREAAAVERRADAVCAAFLLRDRLADARLGRPVSCTVTGLIDAGLFVVFDEVFTGFLPSRRLEDDHYRADPLGVALVGRGDRPPRSASGTSSRPASCGWSRCAGGSSWSPR